MNTDLFIQWLDSSGWVTNTVIDNGTNLNGNLINNAMRDVQNYFPGKRIRAVDANGRVVDIYS